jgi:transposase
LLPPPKKTGRPRRWPMREIMNAIFYVLRSGCSWRMVPSSASAVVIWMTNSLSGLISGIGGSFNHSMRQKPAGQAGPASFCLNVSVRGGVPERGLEDS